MTSLRQQIRRWVEHFLRRDRERLPSSEPGLADQQLADSLARCGRLHSRRAATLLHGSSATLRRNLSPTGATAKHFIDPSEGKECAA